MISLERIQDIRFQFDILEPKDEFMHLRNLISKKIEEEKGNVAFWAKLLVKVNNTVDEILNVLDNEHKNETKSHIEIIKRIINNFIRCNSKCGLTNKQMKEAIYKLNLD